MTANTAVAAAAAIDHGSSGTDSSITKPWKPKSGRPHRQLKLPLRVIRDWWRKRKDCPSPVASYTESIPDELPEEDCRRLIQLVITNERTEFTENEKIRIVEDKVMAIAVAYFDFNFDDKEGPGVSPFILINQKLLRNVELDGLYEKYDPENPPVALTNPDGTKVKLLGEFSAKWSPKGPIKEYAGQQIFLNPNSFTTTRCVVLPETSPHEVLVGLSTIKELKLDVPLPTIATIEGQGEKRVPRPRINPIAINEKASQLSAEREAQLREQRRIEKMMQREKANAKGKKAWK